jgi:hypothetical protein
MRKLTIAGAFLAGILACIILLCIHGFEDEPTPGRQKKQAPGFHPPFTIPAMPDSISFAGEPVPLNRWEVREYLDRELLFNYYMPANIFYMLKLSGRYFPMIEAELKANNIPDDFKYLCVAESNLQNAVSKVGASGFWQFMKDTAPAYNLEITGTVDERYHIQKSTSAACKYLRTAYARFGNWTAAAASYNCGMAGYAARSTHQGTNYYYDLALPEETQRYIFRILAFKHLLGNAASLGFALPDSGVYSPLKTRDVIVERTIPNLAIFAKENGSSYKMLKLLNPWLTERTLTVRSGQRYTIKLPAD